MNKKRVFSIITVVSIIMALSILFVILYLKTDFLKTKEQLFWKYFANGKDEIVSVFSNEESEQYSKKIKKSSYIKEGNIKIESKNNFISPINIKISEKGNKNIDCKNLSINVIFNKNNIENMSIIKDENYYLIKNESIGSDYLGLENTNLKQFASDLGIADTTLIPNRIQEIDWNELFSIDDSDIQYIKKKYIPIFRKHIKNKDYKIIKNTKLDNSIDDVTTYELELSEKQINDVIVDLLENISRDERALGLISNKIKIIDAQHEYCNTDKLKEKIKDISDKLSNKFTSNEKVLSIIIYKKENNVIKAEIVLKNNRTVSIEKNNENEIVIKQYNVENFDFDLKSLSGIVETCLNCISEVTYYKEIEDEQINKAGVNIVCNFGIETVTIKYNYVEQIKNNVENLVRKQDIEYIDLRKCSKETLKLMLQKVLKIDTFEDGKNY